MFTEPAGVRIAGTRLRQLRKLTGSNLKTFAAQIGCSFQYLSQLERGTRKHVGPALFVRICDELEIARTQRRELIDESASEAAA
ncbi:helix-turn-helix domain-containing protein [Amycolatopsis sp. H20-H5]|uniref:helix-turn-helix domain-containing protein n=1 Tax=Amycolatopsis sp. H20-H5 TaxID=3046309 RepID=UPI002DB85E9B|nr:helix-turn-helix transcriptional regulator [Amycolatopsis sp. H20-H5]MEC3977871.1 helix-turn-helix transcriptional regulator [Amycolatopsis sp. H20-H5]